MLMLTSGMLSCITHRVTTEGVITADFYPYPVENNEPKLAGETKASDAKIIRMLFGDCAFVYSANSAYSDSVELSRIGVKGYGTGLFLGYQQHESLADLGLVGTVSKYVAEYHSRKTSL